MRVGMPPTVMVAGPGFLTASTLAIAMVAAMAAVMAAVMGSTAFGGHPLAAATRLADPVVRMDGAFREPFALVATGAGASAVPAVVVVHHGVLAALAGWAVGAAAAPVMRTAGADQQGQRGDEDQRMDSSHGGPP